MATEFVMPKLGLTMEEGTILEWLVADGDVVDHGTAVLRIETDKTETDVEASGSGRLHIVGQVGETFACGTPIGWFLGEGEDPPAASTVSASATPPAGAANAASTTSAHAVSTASAPVASTGRIIASPKARRLAGERNIDLRRVRGTGPGGRIVSEDLDGVSASTTAPPVAAAARPVVAGGATPPATAAARQLAELLGIDLAAVGVDPTDGRVTRDGVALHVRTLLAPATAPATPATPSAPAPAAAPLPAATQEPTGVVPLSGMRGTIAKRMHESLRSMAQLTLFMDADLDAVVADRTARKGADTGGSAPSYTDYVIAAAARALVQHPQVNSQITDDGVALLGAVHVGMAVALDEGLIVPIISNTTSLDLTALSTESTRLAEAARSGSLGLSDLEGGTFSVSTLGMFGVDGFTPVINPPNTAILGVGRIRDDIVLDDAGEIGTVKRLTLSLTWDHRAFDGAPAAAFCRTVTELLQDPVALDAPGD